MDSLPLYCLPDILVTVVHATTEEKLTVLTATSIVERLKIAMPIVRRQLQVVEVNYHIHLVPEMTQ